MQTIGLIELLIARQQFPDDDYGKSLFGVARIALELEDNYDVYERRSQLRALLRRMNAANLNSDGQGRIQANRLACDIALNL